MKYIDINTGLLANEPELQKELWYILDEVLALIEKFSPNVKDEFIRLRETFIVSRANEDVNLEDILGSSDDINSLIKAFSIYFMLLNIAEERHEVRKKSANLDETIKKLKKEKFTIEDIRSTLKSVRFLPVFTAHPTESKRRTLLEAHRDISDDLDMIFRFDDQKAKEHFKYKLNLLWQTNLVRDEKIEVLFELDNLLFVVEESILPALCEVN